MYIIMLIEMFILVVVIYVVMMVVSFKGDSDESMLSMYECGFDSVMGSRVSFSYRFFLISVLFLVFDVEVTLMIPLPYVKVGMIQMMGVVMFVLILLGGLLYEYYNGVLMWIEVGNN